MFLLCSNTEILRIFFLYKLLLLSLIYHLTFLNNSTLCISINHHYKIQTSISDFYILNVINTLEISIKIYINVSIVRFSRQRNIFNDSIERIMSTCAICLFSEFNVLTLTAVNLNVIKLIVEALSFKIEKDSVNFLC